MGFLSKLMKKAKPFLPFLLPMVGQGIMGSSTLASALTGTGKLGKMGSFFGGMNPMMRNMLAQSAMGYGTAALSGSKRPGKAAMYAGLASLPFSYMSASQAANAYNQQFAGKKGVGRYRISPEVASVPTYGGEYGKVISRTPFKPEAWGFKEMGDPTAKISPWDILRGKYKEGVPAPSYLTGTDPHDPKGLLVQSPESYTGKDVFEKMVERQNVPVDADIFSKTTPEKLVQMKDGSIVATGGEQVANWLPTAAAQAAAMYGGRMTPEEEWEASKKKRKKELAWMYGVPEDMVEGEMTNPWASGSFWNRGGITSLENGGDVSGPGSGTSDSINANLSDGEFVMTAKAVENLGGGDRYAGARKMYDLMNVLDPESESMSEVV